jgi:hypothetical protein
MRLQYPETRRTTVAEKFPMLWDRALRPVRSLMNSRTVLAALCGIGLATSVGVFQARADQWDRKSILTVNETIQVRDTVLQPGKYVFKLADSNSDRHIVQIFNGNETRIITTVMAIPARRLEPTDKTDFTWWETPPGTARALRQWYYPGDYVGQEFPYPKEPMRLASAETPAPPPAAAAPTPPAETSAAQSEEAQVQAQNTPPPPPPAAETPAPTPSQPAPETWPPQQQLPKTATLYPLIGLSGLLLVGVYALLRLKRMA